MGLSEKAASGIWDVEIETDAAGARARSQFTIWGRTGRHMICGKSTFIREENGVFEAKRFFCKSWRCPRCAPQRKKRLTKEAYLGNPNTFLTLTVRRLSCESPDEGARRLVIAFRRMRQEIQRKKGIGPIPFLAVFEETENGWPHLHILMRAPFINQKWISDFMARRMDSPVCWIVRLKSRKKAAAYVAKYLSKNPVRFTGCQTTWRNSKYLPPRPRKAKGKSPWALSAASLEAWAWHHQIHDDPAEPFGKDCMKIATRSPP